MNELQDPPQLLVTIVDRRKTQKVTDVLQKNQVFIQYVCLAEGTANSDMMDLLGLGSIDKAVIISLIPSFQVSGDFGSLNFSTMILDTLNENLNLSKAKKGIAFTIPLSGVNSPVLHMLEKSIGKIQKNEIEKEVSEMSMNSNHDLILAIINQGYSEELMNSAKTVGATGGTVIHARRINTEETAKFFGISVHGEKEVVAILVNHDNKQKIMKAIGRSSGLNSEAKGIIFSLSVNGIVGLNSDDME